MTTTKQQQKMNRNSVLRGSLVMLLLVALIVVTQLMESVTVTNIISSSIYMNSSAAIRKTNENNFDHLTQQQSSSSSSSSSTTMNNMIQRRSTIHTPIENDLYEDIDNDDNKDREDRLEEEEEEEESSTTVAQRSDIVDDESDGPVTMTALLNQEREGTTTLSTSIVAQTVSTVKAPEVSAQNHNRTLVVVLGNVRGGTPAWKSMIRELLDPNMADLALLVGEGDPTNPPEHTLLHDRAKYIWTVPEYDDWADAMEDIPDKPLDWRPRLFGMTNATRRGNILLGAAQNISGSGALVFMFRFYLSQKLVEHNLLSVYNRFVVTRSDHYYLCVHDLSILSNDYIWVPEGSDHYGICDRHFIASNETVLSALDILPPLVRHPEAYREQVETYPYNTERFLRLRWEQEGLGPLLQRFNRTLFLVASSKDNTRWKPKGKYIKHLDVYLKYSQEYRLSSKACRVRNLQKMKRLRARAQAPKL